MLPRRKRRRTLATSTKINCEQCGEPKDRYELNEDKLCNFCQSWCDCRIHCRYTEHCAVVGCRYKDYDDEHCFGCEGSPFYSHEVSAWFLKEYLESAWDTRRITKIP